MGSRSRLVIVSLVVVVVALAAMLFSVMRQGPSRSAATTPVAPKCVNPANGMVMLTRGYQGTLAVCKPSSRVWSERATVVAIMDGGCEIKPGSYQLRECQLVAKASDGSTWQCSAMADYDKGGPEFSVKKGTDNRLGAGPPLVASIKVGGNAKQPNFALVLRDRLGLDYSVNGPKESTPRVEVLDKSGRVVWKHSMEFG